MGKKSKKNKGGTGSEYFDYAYGVGEAKHMMKRYGVEGASMGNPRMGGTQRSVDDVKNDLAKAMMNDYDTRRSMEAAAMAGDKNAKKYAKKGFKANNIQDAYGVLRDLKKEHVGGGGMDGPKNRSGLTQALVKLDREKQTEKYRQEFATIKDMNALRDDLEAQEEVSNTQPAPIQKSDALARAEDRVAEAEGVSAGALYESNNRDAATDNPPADAAAGFLYDYKDKVKEAFGPLTNTEKEISHAAKRVQDAYGR